MDRLTDWHENRAAEMRDRTPEELHAAACEDGPDECRRCANVAAGRENARACRERAEDAMLNAAWNAARRNAARRNPGK